MLKSMRDVETPAVGGYRTVLDHLLTIRVLSWIYRLFRATRGDALPKFARKTAMGVDVLFR